MVNQKRVDPSRLSHFTSPAETTEIAEKFRVSPAPQAQREIRDPRYVPRETLARPRRAPVAMARHRDQKVKT